MGSLEEFQIFIKPVGAKCNLRCSYCYYLDKQKLNRNGLITMSENVLVKYISELALASNGNNVFFAWHGGEPTMAGLDFFRKAVAIQKKLISPDKNIINGIQTNATLLNDEWCRFLADENFLVGVSIDGPQKYHDINRISGRGTGSFSKTIEGYNLLKKYNIKTEILTVVSSVNTCYPEEVYGFLRDLGSEFLTFLPLVQRVNGNKAEVTENSVNPGIFGKFLISVFDKWISEDIGRMKIQIIEEALRTAFRQEHTLCIFKKTCGGVPVVECNGDFYSCDHFVDNEHLIGNILNHSLPEMLNSKRQNSFGLVKKNTLPQYCLDCEVLEMCNGECPKNRFIQTPDGETGLNYLCEGYKQFFTYILPFSDAVAEAWRKG
jgi:uncharacterized protein